MDDIITYGAKPIKHDSFRYLKQKYASYILTPSCNFLKFWEIVLSFLLIYALFLNSYKISFLKLENIDEINWLRALEIIVDILFILDVFINFNKAYIDYYGNLVTNRFKIAFHYFKNWMILDIITAFPYEIFTSFFLIKIIILL